MMMEVMRDKPERKVNQSSGIYANSGAASTD
jgi:hypothetical protein